jgi:hypothetical protein
VYSYKPLADKSESGLNKLFTRFLKADRQFMEETRMASSTSNKLTTELELLKGNKIRDQFSNLV